MDRRKSVAAVHAAAGGVAMLCIASFLGATLWAELVGNRAEIAAVKRGIVHGLAVLVPALALAGASGAALAGRSRAAIVRAKQRRMRWAAANGLLVLVPAALALDRLAAADTLGTAFHAVQAVELVAGPANLGLLLLNLRDGLRMRRARDRGEARPRPLPPPQDLAGTA